MVIYKPLRKIRISAVTRPILLYVTLQVVQALLPYTVGARYGYNPQLVICAWQIRDVVAPRSPGYYLLWVFLTILQFALPVFPIIGCCVCCVYQLRSSTNSARNYASGTVLIVTVLYILFNFPLAIYLILALVDIITGRFNIGRHYYLNNFMQILSVVMNAALNPVVYFIRVRQMKCWIKRVASKTFKLNVISHDVEVKLVKRRSRNASTRF